MNICTSFFYQFFSKIGLEKWKIGFGLICIFRFLEVYIRRAIWEYYFLSGTRVSVKMASISQSAFYIYISLQRRKERNVFPIPGMISNFKPNLEFLIMKRPKNFGGHMQLNSFMNKQNSSSLSEFKLKLGVDGILVANS